MLMPTVHPVKFRAVVLASLAALAVLLLALPSAAHAQEPAPLPAPDRIAGRVIQTTADAALPNGLEVTLITIDGDDVNIDEASVTIGPDGAFEFTGFPMGEGYRYRLMSLYGNLRQTVNIEDTLNPTSVALRIFETTATLDDISATTHVMIVPRVDGKEKIMGVLELVEISNGGDRTFVTDVQNPAPGGVPQLLRFSLPEGFEELTVDSDLPSGNVLEIDTGFALSNAVPPGDFRILYSYVINYDSSEMLLDRSLPFDVHQYRILLPPEFGAVEAEGFTTTTDQLLGDTNYRVLQGEEFQGGDHIQIRFTDLPQPSFFQSFQNAVGGSTLTTVGTPLLAAAAMALLLGYVFFYRNRRRVATSTLGLTREELVREIATLDAEHEAGGMEDEEYDRRRKGLFAEALEAAEPAGPERIDGSG